MPSIAIVTSTRHAYTVRSFARVFSTPTLRIVIANYDDDDNILGQRDAVIFTDFERFRPDQMQAAAGRYDALATVGRGRLDNPRDWQPRRPFLDRLAGRGINRFRAHRADRRQHVRFPAFLKLKYAHAGALTPLLFNEAQIASTLEAARKKGFHPTI